jgi:hypothetical protein
MKSLSWVNEKVTDTVHFSLANFLNGRRNTPSYEAKALVQSEKRMMQ